MLKQFRLTLFFILVLSISFFQKTFSQQDSTMNEFQEWAEDEGFIEWNDSLNSVNSDEFIEWIEKNDGNSDILQENQCKNKQPGQKNQLSGAFTWVLLSLLFTIIAGYLVRYKKTRNLRGLFLLAALIIYGFYRGACPCPVMSFQNLFFALIGQDVHWSKYIWFLGLLPVTYVFGKVWCGWICHLGALQEFIFMPRRFKLLQGATAQKIMLIIRIILLITLIVQIFITKTNLYVKIDPFKVAFNLFSANMAGWILLGLLVISSVFVYRPFCKTACPIGIILGWVTKIPGAAIIGAKGKCISCIQCHDACKIRAITRNNKISTIDNQECIACGDCIDSCRQSGLDFVRHNKLHRNKAIFKFME